MFCYLNNSTYICINKEANDYHTTKKLNNMKTQITKITKSGYEWLVNTNDVIDNVETLISFLKQEGKEFIVKNNVELFANPSDCSEMDEVAYKEWN